jgi:hypothetical protein
MFLLWTFVRLAMLVHLIRYELVPRFLNMEERFVSSLFGDDVNSLPTMKTVKR